MIYLVYLTILQVSTSLDTNIKFSLKTVWHYCDFETWPRSLKVIRTHKDQWIVPSCKIWHLPHLHWPRKSQRFSFCHHTGQPNANRYIDTHFSRESKTIYNNNDCNTKENHWTWLFFSHVQTRLHSKRKVSFFTSLTHLAIFKFQFPTHCILFQVPRCKHSSKFQDVKKFLSLNGFFKTYERRPIPHVSLFLTLHLWCITTVHIHLLQNELCMYWGRGSRCTRLDLKLKVTDGNLKTKFSTAVVWLSLNFTVL